jgi:acetyl esterase/lipase
VAGEEDARDGGESALAPAEDRDVAAMAGDDHEDEDGSGEEVPPRCNGKGRSIGLADERAGSGDGDDGHGEQPEIPPVHVLTVRSLRAEEGDEVTTIEVDAAIRTLLAQLEAMGGASLEQMSPTEARESYKLLAAADGTAEEVATVADTEIAGVPVRVYRPLGAAPGAVLPTLVWFHGGGFVIGDLDTADPTARKLANRSGSIVVSVDYRRAPEHTFPAAPEDCWAVTSAIAAGAAAAHGGDSKRLAVGGDSAGGDLAAVTAVRARDSGITLRHQLLVYPITDLRMGFPSIDENGEGYLLTKAGMRWFHDHYLAPGEAEDPMASPLLTADLTGVAPAHVLTAGFDPLRDEGDAYAAALAAAGVDVVHDRYPSMIHGFFAMGSITPVAEEAVTKAAELLADRCRV